ncbi:MAG: hypothetical protein WBV46_13505 [Terriglobales bacterium]|jgi:hypothetical protein
MEKTETVRPRGFVPIGIFFIFGATMAAYAAITLILQGTFLDRLWALNKQAHAALLPVANISGPLFLILSAALAAAAMGWFRRLYWGWLLGLIIVAINAVGDLANLVRGEALKGAVGVVIAGVLLIYMSRTSVRNYFGS